MIYVQIYLYFLLSKGFQKHPRRTRNRKRNQKRFVKLYIELNVIFINSFNTFDPYILYNNEKILKIKYFSQGIYFSSWRFKMFKANMLIIKMFNYIFMLKKQTKYIHIKSSSFYSTALHQ